MRLGIKSTLRVLLGAFCLLPFLLAACGGGGDSSSTSSNSSATSQVAVATMPSGNFKAAGENQITTTVGSTVTQATTATTATTQTQTVAASAEDLDRGARSYVKNKCNECHGAKGEGVAGKTMKPIGATALSADKFDNFLRTGGGLGNDHIFGPSAISPGGMTALYAYVESLAGK